MNYKEKYKDALERAKGMWEQGMMPERIEYIFPELKESEDEKIRKMLIRIYKKADMGGEIFGEGITYKQVLAWLEKQGDYNRLVEEIKERKELISKEKEKATSTNDKLSLGGRTAILEELLAFTKEKQDEQKETLCDKCRKEQPSHSCQDITELGRCAVEHEQNPADKIEPKFKVGDWVVFNNQHNSVYQIEKIENYEYTLKHFLGGSMPLSFSQGDMIRAWTIQDAKEGDVLACDDEVTDCPFIFHDLNKEQNPRSYCGVNTVHQFQVNDESGGHWCRSDEAIPATKEQRELLFKKMKEAGYEWNAEKKELKQLSQSKVTKISEQVWSKEDEKMMKDTIFAIDSAGNYTDDEKKRN